MIGESRSEDIRVMDADWGPVNSQESVPACVTRGWRLVEGEGGGHKAREGIILNTACFPPCLGGSNDYKGISLSL